MVLCLIGKSMPRFLLKINPKSNFLLKSAKDLAIEDEFLDKLGENKNIF